MLALVLQSAKFPAIRNEAVIAKRFLLLSSVVCNELLLKKYWSRRQACQVKLFVLAHKLVTSALVQ
jgi:hypothetical protein